jgi:prepilin-type N-terminal cleavage/methylation domain-containing protein
VGDGDLSIQTPRSALRTPHSKGFTLLEVTLALAILAFAFTALSSLQARNLILTAEDRGLTQATLAARDVLAALQAGLLPLEGGEGNLGEEHPRWRWRTRVKETALSGSKEEPLKGLMVVELTVFEGNDPDQGTSFWILLRKEMEEGS